MTDDFEKWWQEHGQFCRAGGGEYEKTFAFRAWEAAVSEERAGCVEVCRRRAKAMQETIRAANPRTSEHLMLRRDARMEEARECANEIIERSNGLVQARPEAVAWNDGLCFTGTTETK